MTRTRKNYRIVSDRSFKPVENSQLWTLAPDGTEVPDTPVVMILSWNDVPTFLFDEEGVRHDIKSWGWSERGKDWIYVLTPTFTPATATP